MSRQSGLNILFVSRLKKNGRISPIVENQAVSLMNAGCNIHSYVVKYGGLTGYIQAANEIKSLLEKQSFDLIHAHYGLCGLSALFGNSKKIPLVVSFMGDDILGSNRKDGKVKLASKALSLFNRMVARWFYSGVILKSREMYEKFRYNSHIIPNGVDTIQFQPKDKLSARNKLNLAHDKTLIIFVSDPKRPEKNYSLPHKAIEYLQQENIEFVAVYDQPADTIPMWMNSADLLVLSSFHEGSPNVIKEAMACNCPIVSTNVGDVKEVIGDTEGCFISSYQPVEFATHIDKAIHFSNETGRTNGRQRIMELGLDDNTIANKIIAVYKEILNNDTLK